MFVHSNCVYSMYFSRPCHSTQGIGIFRPILSIVDRTTYWDAIHDQVNFTFSTISIYLARLYITNLDARDVEFWIYRRTSIPPSSAVSHVCTGAHFSRPFPYCGCFSPRRGVRCVVRFVTPRTVAAQLGLPMVSPGFNCRPTHRRIANSLRICGWCGAPIIKMCKCPWPFQLALRWSGLVGAVSRTNTEDETHNTIV